ncbi:hypothetical protein BCR42DRAFT_496419 [Absidia repens]|uniref:Heterokaryon incompatibility domain-containing protein n=1 Tax=Absidia repens TaxID=90262 RepID=A0A1X2HZX7_9FUNG|nr:hypothetical protein BCR42DRAFT_496419 [Absidia repens]
MTKDDPVERLSQESTSNDTQQQQQQEPFKVVLVDIEKASELEIHCVEMPLEGNVEELSFVALSYRWGELHETTVDTQLDYLATVTSFNSYDFYRLCKIMTYEPDLKQIKYVWVDAICVNQTNYDRRKATIHQMSNIYAKATYILAVPDLHMRHLMNTYTEHYKNIEICHHYSEYIYHLIQGNIDQLHRLDSQFLDKIKVPADRTLRQLLAKCTTYLADGFTTRQQHDHNIAHPEDALDLLCEIYHTSLLAKPPRKDLDYIKNQTQQKEEEDGGRAGDNNDDDGDPLDESLLCYDKVASIILEEPERRWMKIGKIDKIWTHELIKRRNAIRKAMEFIEDIIVDWSSRVWVISEYTISKKKNNLKYWFIQLSAREMLELPFFTFDFTNPAFDAVVQKTDFAPTKNKTDPNSNPAHLSFHRLVIKQLNTQTFFEMIFKSKATKNEDRFYAILPQSKYKDRVSQVDHWKITTLMSAKLKLFEIMDTRDKWNLLFLSGSRTSSVMHGVLPSFCASDIGWAEISTFVEEYPCNFDMHNDQDEGTFSPISLHHQRTKALRLPCLQLIPKEYYVEENTCKVDDSIIFPSRLKETLYNRLQVDQHSSVLDIVFLPQYDEKAIPSSIRKQYARFNCIPLIGCFVENKWMLCRPRSIYQQSECNHYYNHDNDIVFNIY